MEAEPAYTFKKANTKEQKQRKCCEPAIQAVSEPGSMKTACNPSFEKTVIGPYQSSSKTYKSRAVSSRNIGRQTDAMAKDSPTSPKK